MTPGMVVGQDLGLTLDIPLFHRRAQSAGITLTTDRLVVGGSAGSVTVLHHPTGALEEDALWHALRDGPSSVHRIGDAVAPRRAGAAIREGDRVGARL